MGLVTAFGRARDTWAAVREGRSGVRLLDLDRGRVLGAPAVSFSASDSREPNVALALAAARDAVADAGLARDDLAGPRAACTVSSSKGGMKSLFECHRAFCEGAAVPVDFWEIVSPSTPGAAVAREFGVTGPVVNYAAACATGVHAVIAAARLIAAGDADVVLAGATDASLVQPLVAAFDRMGVLSRRFDDPAGACRPFDRARDGFAIGEGAAVMVIESGSRVASSMERVYAWLTGSSWGADAFDLARIHPSRGALARLLRDALHDAALDPSRVGYVCAHGTGTQGNDAAEAAAIREALGAHWETTPVSSLKPAIGHLLTDDLTLVRSRAARELVTRCRGCWYCFRGEVDTGLSLAGCFATFGLGLSVLWHNAALRFSGRVSHTPGVADVAPAGRNRGTTRPGFFEGSGA